MLAAVVALLATAPATSLLQGVGTRTAGSTRAVALREESSRDRVPSATAGHDVPIAPPPATFDAPAAPAARPPAALRSAATPGPSGGVWAVVIGIDDYPGSRSDLRASVNDANDVDAALAAYGVSGDRRLVLRNTQVTAGTIADSLRWLVARAGSDSTAVFFYAGHVRKLGAGSEAIVAADGQLVTDVAMADLLRPLAAKQTWIGMASCYAGGFTEVLAPGRILTGAADADSLAYESSSFARSYLVEYMVRRAMIQAQAPGSIEQSFAWAADALRNEHPDRVPVQYDQVNGELHLGAPPKTAAPAPASPPPSGGGSQPSPADDEPEDPPKRDEDGCVVRLGSLVGCGG